MPQTSTDSTALDDELYDIAIEAMAPLAEQLRVREEFSGHRFAIMASALSDLIAMSLGAGSDQHRNLAALLVDVYERDLADIDGLTAPVEHA